MTKPVEQMNDEELRDEGWKALVKRLGVAGATRFMAESERGVGDYTRDRMKWLGRLSLKDITTAIGAKQRKKGFIAQ